MVGPTHCPLLSGPQDSHCRVVSSPLLPPLGQFRMKQAVDDPTINARHNSHDHDDIFRPQTEEVDIFNIIVAAVVEALDETEKCGRC